MEMQKIKQVLYMQFKNKIKINLINKKYAPRN